ncbi:MAG: hypothetical protein NUW21_07110 [Elusimicrobia bacterium]|nr:hypothetical protein [Elusimicrobiota bacterium]
MSLTGRNAGLALAALLILFWAVARLRSGALAVPAPPPAAEAAPTPPSPPPAAPVKKVRPRLAAKPPAPPATAPVRGAKLREKGEAFGGGTPDRVDEAAGRVTP